MWFGSWPDVLLSRHYEVTNVAKISAMQTYGLRTFLDKYMRQTILLGPDKMCWPPDASKPEHAVLCRGRF